jgi:predicted nucleotidyltransferase
MAELATKRIPPKPSIMSFLFTELRRVTSDLHQSGVNWCLVGGLATSVYVEPRTTKDIDVALSVSGEEQANSLKNFLLARGYTNPQLLMHVSPTRRMGWRVFIPSSHEACVPLDILVLACGIEREIVAHAITIEILPGLSLPVASLAHLAAMKVLSQNSSDRLQDRVDLFALLKRATTSERSIIERALADMSKLEIANGRDLVAELGELEATRTRAV